MINFKPYIKYIIFIVLVAAAFAWGRLSAPEKVITKVEIKEVEVVKEVIKESKKNNKEVIIVKVKYPDGTERTETHIVDKGEVVIDSKKETEIKTETKTETIVVNKQHDWSVGVMWQPINKYGLQIDKRLIGPLFVGVYGQATPQLQESVIGAIVRLEF